MTIEKKKVGVSIFFVLLIFLSVLVVYFNTFNHSFHFDDIHSIVENPSVREVGNIPEYFKDPGMFSGKAGVRMYRPLLLVTYAVNYWFGGYDVFGYHLVNILLHAFNALFVYLIALYLFSVSVFRSPSSQLSALNSLSPAFISALFFAVHTINTHAVNYISSRSVLLVSFFYLGAFYFYLKSGDRTKKNLTSNLLPLTSVFYFLSLLFYSCSLLSKEIAVTFPIVLILYDYLFKKESSECRVQSIDKGVDLRSRLSALSSQLFWHIPFWVITVGYLLIRKSLFGKAVIKVSKERLLGGGGGVEVEGVRSIYINLLTQSKAIVYYIKSLFLPTGLSVEHTVGVASGVGDTGVIVSLVVVLCVLMVAVGMRRRHVVITFGVLWFFVVLLPETILPLNLIINEHRVYLPGVGFVLIAGYGIYIVQERLGLQWRGLMLGAVLLIMVLYAYGTVKRNEVWKDDVTLWQNVVEKYPNNAWAHINVGVGYAEQGLLNEALEAYQKSIVIDSAIGDAHYNAGNVYRRLGRFDEAINAYMKAIILNPEKSLEAHSNLGLVFVQMKKFDNAISHYKKALDIMPDDASVHYNLANAYRKNDLLNEAISEYKEVLRLKGDHFGAYNNLGVLYGMEGRFDESITSLRKALDISPDNKEARVNLGIAYIKEGDCESAEIELRSLLESEPDNAKIRAYLNECGQPMAK